MNESEVEAEQKPGTTQSDHRLEADDAPGMSSEEQWEKVLGMARELKSFILAKYRLREAEQ